MRNLFPVLLPAIPMPFIGDDYPSAFIPQLWANESLAILEENMVMAALVHRDFENVIQSYGDTVNTRKPGEFKSIRKASTDPVTVQTPTATNIPVVLNQQLHTTFLIRDADQSKAFEDLVVEYLRPAMLSLARQADQIVSSQAHQFYQNAGGHLMGLNGEDSEQYLLETRQIMNQNKAYTTGRNLVLSTAAETALLSNRDFLTADKVGDEGTAMREASLGRKLGFDIFMSQNMPLIQNTGFTNVTGAINATVGYSQGQNTFTVDGFSAAIPVNSFITIAGDDTPLRVVSTVGGATPTQIVTDNGLRHAVANNAVVTVWGGGGVTTQAYTSGWVKGIATNNCSVQAGQAVTFGNSYVGSNVYTVIEVDAGGSPTTPNIILDRPLVENVASGAAINVGPPGSYSFAFHRNAIALVNRPLALPMPGTGARAAQASYNNISMRVTMAYDPYAQGHLVTCDSLLGVAVLDKLLGALMLG